MNRGLGVILLCVMPFMGFSQINRYVVFFADKAESSFSIENPEAFLSDNSIERRQKQNITITEQDLPVNANYLDSLVKYGATTFHTSRWMNAALVESEESVLESLVAADYVLGYEYVAPGQKLQENPEPLDINYAPTDPEAIKASSDDQLALIGADVMHEDGFTGKEVTIAMLDAGFISVNESSIFSNVFDNDRLLDVKDFVSNQNDAFSSDDHGTSAFSCIASKSNDLTGAAFDARFALYVTEDVGSEYRVEEYNWLFAAERADSLGADIISSSLGYNEFNDPTMDYTYEEADGNTAVVSQAAKWASDRGILVVNSAGNEGNNVNTWPYIVMPSDVDEVLAVAAVTNEGVRASFSSVGPAGDGTVKPDVAAMGVNVAVYNDKNQISSLNGTSFAAPLIAGLAAGLWEKFPELTNLELKELIISSSNKQFSPDSLLGYGIPNYIYAGTNRVLSVQQIMEDIVSVFPNPFDTDRISIRIESEYARQTIRFVLHSPEGKLINSTSIKKYKKGDVLDMNIHDVSKGIYILTVTTEGISKNVKLLRY